MKKLLALLLALVMVFALAACQDSTNDPTDPPETQETPAPTDEGTEPTETEPVVIERDPIENYEYGTDYISLYEAIGDQVTLDDVYEDNGIAYVTVDGEQYELGMDFLSMAMVYKTTPAEGSAFATPEDMYNEWWRYYIQRWNYLLPELPLYSNQYYHVYNAKIAEGYEVTPYWSAARSVITMRIDETKGENSIVLGSSTDLTGSFRFSSMGKSNPAASDNDIGFMMNGLDTVVTTPDGEYVWNDTVVAEHTEEDHEDGSRTYTIKINEGLKFSDGSDVTAKNYLTSVLAFSTPVGAEAAGRDHQSGMNYVGYEEFAAYDGTEGSGSPVFSGIRLLDDYTFAITVGADYLPYYYDIAYAGFGAQPLAAWLGEFDIIDEGNGCYLSEGFYAKEGESYTHAAHMVNTKTSTEYPCSGAYIVTGWDASELTATMELNPYFPGDYRGIKPTVEKVTYVKLVAETQNEWLSSGRIDILPDVTGADQTNSALQVATDNPEKFLTTYYNRAGYGKLHFRSDFGPISDVAVRQAIAYSMDRNAFAQSFTGGYGTTVNGPFYMGSLAYLANETKILLDSYAVSEAMAIDVLEQGGWIYNAEGGEYTEGVRYKKLSKSEQTDVNKAYASYKGDYQTVEIDGEYYMPLVINWFCTEDNEFSELLKTAWAESEITAAIGMVVQYQQGTFTQLQGELYQLEAYGYAGTPLFSAFNFATGFNAAVYDYSWNWTVDPSLYESYSIAYMKDEADFYWMGE